MKNFKEKIKLILISYCLILGTMWLCFFINNITNNFINNFGIQPRNLEFKELIGILFSWCMHANDKQGSWNYHNWSHIINNTIVLSGLLFFVVLFEKKVFQILFLLISSSGIMVWLLGSPNSIHVGASGLVFALFGYVIASATIGKNFKYLIPIGIAFYFYGMVYFYSFLDGLMIREGVSFAAHFGGLISGLLIGFYYNKVDKKNSIYGY